MAGNATSIRVEVLSNGDARWTAEKKIPLETLDDVVSWDATASQDVAMYKSEFDVRMEDVVSRISASVGRPMAAKGVNVTVEEAVWWTGGNGTGDDIRLFSPGEPSIMARKAATAPLSLEWWMLLPAILVAAAAGFGAGYLLFRRQSPQSPTELPPLPDAGTDIGPQEDRYMSDEEKVIMYLEEAGGQMFQSDLVRRTDFSKSKLSMVLSGLDDKGTITKIKKGKENLIRLNRNEEPDDKGGPA